MPAGAFIAVVGPSGAGKTTLLKLLAGFLRPQRGSLRVLGEEAGGGVPRHLRCRLGYIPQQLGLVRSLSARDNVLMGALGRLGVWTALTGSMPREERRAALAILDRLGIGDKADEKLFRLSGGQRQRVAIARTLLQRPSVIFADEFVSDLDSDTAQEIIRLVRGIGEEEGLTFIATMHEPHLVRELADQVFLVKGGRVHPAPVSGAPPERWGRPP